MKDRVRAALATLSSAPWRRAPVLLARSPAVLLIVAGACAVLAAAASAVPLFLSSVGTESVALQAAERCPRDTGATLPFAATPADIGEPSADPFLPVADRLGPSDRWASVADLTLGGADPERTTEATLLTRPDVLEHVEVLAGAPGPGVWISDRAAADTGLEVGEEATLNGVAVPVAGVYRDVAGTTVDDYWCAHGRLVLLEARGADLVLPPPLVLADASTFAALMVDLGVDQASGAWAAPLRHDLTVADTEDLTHTLACRTEEGRALAWCDRGQPLIYRGFRLEPEPAHDDADFVERYLLSALPFVSARARATQTSVGGGIWPMAGLAALAGVGLVAAAASLWFDRRRREVALLSVRGVSPAGLGLKAVLELSGPLLAGAASGIGLAYGVVVWLGPSPVVERSAVRAAAGAGGLALAVGALTVVVIVARRVRSLEAPQRSRRIRLGLLPWELALGWATLVSYRRLGDWGVPVGRGADVSRVDVWGLLFPVLFLVTAVAVLSRLVALLVGPLRSLSRSWPTALYLGVRRVARYRVAVIGLAAASAIAAGVLGYAATMNRSLDATLEAKAATYVGSDLAVRLRSDEPIPAALADRATEVRLHIEAWVEQDGRREGVTVLVIDPATFEAAAFWDDTFASTSLRTILDRLDAGPDGARVPAVVVGSDIVGPADAGIESYGTQEVAIDAIAGVDAFPGMRRAKPTMVVSASAIADVDVGRGWRELWVAGDRAAALAELDATGIGYEEQRRAGEVADRAAFQTVAWTFGFMQSLGISAGLLVLGGVAVYLDARRRDRLLGYAFMQRMGLRAAQHRRALGVELAASVLLGCWMGLAIALAAARVAHQRIDPVPGFHPDPLLRPAGALIVGLAAASLVLAGAAARLAQRRIDRDDPVEVLRAGA